MCTAFRLEAIPPNRTCFTRLPPSPIVSHKASSRGKAFFVPTPGQELFSTPPPPFHEPPTTWTYSQGLGRGLYWNSKMNFLLTCKRGPAERGLPDLFWKKIGRNRNKSENQRSPENKERKSDEYGEIGTNWGDPLPPTPSWGLRNSKWKVKRKVRKTSPKNSKPCSVASQLSPTLFHIFAPAITNTISNTISKFFVTMRICRHGHGVALVKNSSASIQSKNSDLSLAKVG